MWEAGKGPRDTGSGPCSPTGSLGGSTPLSPPPAHRPSPIPTVPSPSPRCGPFLQTGLSPRGGRPSLLGPIPPPAGSGRAAQLPRVEEGSRFPQGSGPGPLVPNSSKLGAPAGPCLPLFVYLFIMIF